MEKAKSLGNHELDEAVSGLTPFIGNLTTPVLAANLILRNVPELESEKNLLKSTVIVKKGVSIGIIGYLTPDTKFRAPRNEIEYEDEVIAIRREVSVLKSKGVNILIALGHSGFLKDVEIAKQVEDIDVVIGGHSNTFLWNEQITNEKPEIPEGPYPFIIQQESGRKVPVVQAYAYTKYLGKLHLLFDNKGEIIKVGGHPILLDNEIPRDPELLDIVNKYRDSIYEINNQVVGVSKTTLNGKCRLRECNLGSLITDTVLRYTQEYHSDSHSDARIAIIQGGRIRSSIDRDRKPFELTRGDWITVLPFADTLNIVTMNGSILLKALEHSVGKWRHIDSAGEFLQMSGMTVVYDLSENPGKRVISAHAKCSSCENPELAPVRLDYEYKVIMPAFIANGGDGYTMFDGLPREILPYDELTCVFDYLSNFSPIDPKPDGRITMINVSQISISNLIPNRAVQLNLTISYLLLAIINEVRF